MDPPAPVMRPREAQAIIAILRAPELAVAASIRNRRFRADTERLNSGPAGEVTKVLGVHVLSGVHEDLSFGERRRLDQARSLLVPELALAQRVDPARIEGEIQVTVAARPRGLRRHGPRRGGRASLFGGARSASLV